MGFDAHEQEQTRQLRAAMNQADISSGELWLKYFSIGGSVGEYEVEAFLQGLLSLPELQRDLLAFAVNEMIDDLPPLPRAPYAEDLQGGSTDLAGGSEGLAKGHSVDHGDNAPNRRSDSDSGSDSGP